jgi:hypothetical protein
LETLTVLVPASIGTRTDVVCCVLLPDPLTRASTGAPPLTETKNERLHPELVVPLRVVGHVQDHPYALGLAGLDQLAEEVPLGGAAPGEHAPAQEQSRGRLAQPLL